jgi:hypothetical protein
MNQVERTERESLTYETLNAKCKKTILLSPKSFAVCTQHFNTQEAETCGRELMGLQIMCLRVVTLSQASWIIHIYANIFTPIKIFQHTMI